MKDIKFKDKIAQGINDLFYIWKREFQTTFRDQGVLIFFILVPLGYPLLYSFIYDNEVVREVPAVVVDDSHSSLSREYLRKVDATPDVQIIAYCADMEEAKQMLKNRLAYGIIYIPSDFSDNIAKGKQTQVSIYCDMSGLLYYKSMLIANTAVSLDMNKDIKIARSGNTTERQDEITGYPIEYEEISIFNPTAGFAAFLIPAVLVLIIQQTLLLGIGLAAGTARENNRFKDLVPINRHYNGTLRIVLGQRIELFPCIRTSIVLRAVYRAKTIQPQPDRTTRFTDTIRCPLSGSLHFLCNDYLHCHSQPGNLYADFCIHLRTVAVYFRHLMAGSGNSSVLEICILHLPVYIRYQWLCENQ